MRLRMKWILLLILIKWRLYVNKYSGEKQLKYWIAKKKQQQQKNKSSSQRDNLADGLSPWFTVDLVLSEIHQLINNKRQQKLFHE